MPTITELARQFSELIDLKERRDVEDKASSLDMHRIEEQLLNAMSDEGMQNIKLTSGRVFYRCTDKFFGVAEGVEKDDLIAELARHPETMDLVSPAVNMASLRARVKEMEGLGESLPEEVQKLVHVTEKFRVKYRKS